jgi:hypothetical protein
VYQKPWQLKSKQSYRKGCFIELLSLYLSINLKREKMAKLSNKSAAGTSFHGHTVTATPNQLIEALGEPQFGWNGGQDKCNFDWICETNDGAVFTIYDWKEYKPLNMDSYYEFHIGAFHGFVADRALSEIRSKFIVKKV